MKKYTDCPYCHHNGKQTLSTHCDMCAMRARLDSERQKRKRALVALRFARRTRDTCASWARHYNDAYSSQKKRADKAEALTAVLEIKLTAANLERVELVAQLRELETVKMERDELKRVLFAIIPVLDVNDLESISKNAKKAGVK